jgi:hypothetical protein
MTPTPPLFALGDILSITTGHLLSERGIDGIRDLLSYMTGTSLVNTQLPDACDVCQPFLLACYPTLSESALWEELAAFDAHRPTTPEADAQYLQAWLAPLMARHGARLPIPRLPEGTTDFSTPAGDLLATLLDRNPHAAVFILKPQETDDRPREAE